jgi:hypothetical protein
MPVTVNSVFNACASNPQDMANAEPYVIFTGGKLTTDANGGKLMIVRFLPYLQGVTDFQEVAFHVHLKPYQGQSGMNLRGATSGSGDVGAGIGQRARGAIVDKYSEYYRFFAKLKSEARFYILRQIQAEMQQGKLRLMVPFKMNTDEKEKGWLWEQPRFWDKTTGFTTDSRDYSKAARAAVLAGAPNAGSIEAAGADARTSALADGDGAMPPVIGAPDQYALV